MNKSKLLFKFNDEIILEETNKLSHHEIFHKKDLLAKDLGCNPENIQIEFFEESSLDSDIDVDNYGDMIYWESVYPTPIVGLDCILKEGSDEYLDALIDGTITKFLIFTTK